MNIKPLKTEVKRVSRFLESGNIKAADNILSTATPQHKVLVRSMLAPDIKTLFDEAFL